MHVVEKRKQNLDKQTKLLPQEPRKRKTWAQTKQNKENNKEQKLLKIESKQKYRKLRKQKAGSFKNK